MVDARPTRRTDHVAISLKRRAASRKSDGEELAADLTALSLRLCAIYATSVTAQLSLRSQAAEQDAEIACALRAGVCHALGDQIRELDDIIPRVDAQRSRG